MSFRACQELTFVPVGKVSFELWLLLTWSLGCTGFLLPILPPKISMARFETTSLTFMFVWVPDPVCQTLRGKCSLSLPAITSSQACAMASETFLSKPNCVFTVAQAFFNRPNASIKGSGIRSKPSLMTKGFSVSCVVHLTGRNTDIEMKHGASRLSTIVTVRWHFDRTKRICFCTGFSRWYRNFMMVSHACDLLNWKPFVLFAYLTRAHLLAVINVFLEPSRKSRKGKCRDENIPLIFLFDILLSAFSTNPYLTYRLLI